MLLSKFRIAPRRVVALELDVPHEVCVCVCCACV
jgi:hypothetical protein